MASWIARLSGETEDPGHIRELLGKLKQVAAEPQFGTGSSEFTSAHASASNFHVPDPEPQAPGVSTGAPGGEATASDWTPGGAPTPS